MLEVDRLLAYIRQIRPDPSVLPEQSDDRYRSLPLCAIDAVYSIGVRYESTERTVSDFCKWSRWNYDQEYTVNEFIHLLVPFDGEWEKLAKEVFRNRQRTSSRSGTLKAEAVYRFVRELHRCGINTHTDLSRTGPHECLVSAITAIPGQSSGISLKYFLMLAGYEGIIKPDRMVSRFVAEALGRKTVAPDFAERLILAAHTVLKAETPRLTASILDYRIWRHQRNRH